MFLNALHNLLQYITVPMLTIQGEKFLFFFLLYPPHRHATINLSKTKEKRA